MIPPLTPEFFLKNIDEAIQSSDLSEEHREQLRAARERLAVSPGLLKGGPDQDFTYSDPILEQALYTLRLMYSPDLLEMAREGGDLRDTPRQYARWLTAIWAAVSKRHDPSLMQLAARQPSEAATLDCVTPRIAVVGDAGYQGQAQTKVLQLIRETHAKRPFDAVIHLGDVYFAGSVGEMVHHFLTPFEVFYNADPRVPVYTLVGNHDLYYGAESYLHALSVLKQPGRYFAIDTPSWRILCLDTSLGDTSIGRLNGRLDKDQTKWLEAAILGAGSRKLVVMSHHYYVSGWKSCGDSLREQLEALFRDRVVAWYWGHEHGCATYERGRYGFSGACVGNGSFREEWAPPQFVESGSPSWWADGRCACYDTTRRDWAHGFLELELSKTQISERYHLENGTETEHVRLLPVP